MSNTPPVPLSGELPPGLRIEPIPAFRDNYIWLAERDGRNFVVDPGDAEPVLRALRARGRALDAIVVTHHHADHVGGVAQLVQAYGAPVYGPAQTPFAGIDRPLRDGDRVRLLDLDFQVLAVPGHTLDHIAYWSADAGVLFCGDTLFACGCGRLFEGTPAQMHDSLQRLAALPGSTRVYCTHEYTLNNLRFALAVEPDSPALQQRQAECQRLREQGRPTLPSTIALERSTNPFLRCNEPGIRASLHERLDPAANEVGVFAALRSWKDVF